MNCVGEVGLGRGWIVGAKLAWRAAVDCVGKIWIGARLWIASARVGLGRGLGLCRRGWIGARLWFVWRGLDWCEAGLWGRDDGNAAL